MLAAAEAQAATLQRYIDAWKRWNAEETISIFAESEDFRQVTMPFQMNVPERTRSEVEKTLPYVVRAVRNYEVSQTTNRWRGKSTVGNIWPPAPNTPCDSRPPKGRGGHLRPLEGGDAFWSMEHGIRHVPDLYGSGRQDC